MDAFFEPRLWPIWLRRIFVIFLPIAWPLHFIICLVILIISMIAIIIAETVSKHTDETFDYIRQLWTRP